MELAYDNDKIIFSVFPCTIKTKNYYLGKLKDYDQYLVFWRISDNSEEIEMAVLTSHLSFKKLEKLHLHFLKI